VADDNDAALAATAAGLNEDAKAARRRKPRTREEATAAAREHLSGGDTAGAEPLPGLEPGERWHEGDLLPGFSVDGDGRVVDEDGEPTGARVRPLPEGEGGLDAALKSLGASVGRAEDADAAGLDLSEEAHDASLRAMTDVGVNAALSDRSLVADLRDALLGVVRTRPKGWHQTSTAEQRDVAVGLEEVAGTLVRRVVEVVASGGREGVRALLTKVAMGDDTVITAKLKVFQEEDEERAVMLLHRARGRHVTIIPASAEDYRRDGRDPDVDEEEPGLDFEPGRD
jgi:hypothetical protein